MPNPFRHCRFRVGTRKGDEPGLSYDGDMESTFTGQFLAGLGIVTGLFVTRYGVFEYFPQKKMVVKTSKDFFRVAGPRLVVTGARTPRLFTRSHAYLPLFVILTTVS